jgi:hypothetical protein
MRVAALITNYNMPERADALAGYIKHHCDNTDVFLLDNGSDIMAPAFHTTHVLKQNIQTTGGWLYLWEQARGGYDAYWFLITSAEFAECVPNPLPQMVKCFELYSHCVGVHPALTKDSTTSWEHMKELMPGGYRKVWMLDNIACLYRADWFDKHPFDPALKYAWGIDLEMAYHARCEDKSLYISEPGSIGKITDIGYKMQRMNMQAEKRKELARANMEEVFSKRYGPQWKDLLYNEY